MADEELEKLRSQRMAELRSQLQVRSPLGTARNQLRVWRVIYELCGLVCMSHVDFTQGGGRDKEGEGREREEAMQR